MRAPSFGHEITSWR
uniref:Uncharacterized protein n=1 Tax=Arundo donax TaxID=35708 RepID=A0A0A9DX83_ARUDO